MLRILTTCLALLILTATLDSCKKAENDGVNTTIDTSNPLPNEFMSAKKGSYWEYASSGNPDANPYRRTATEIDTIVEGIPMQYYERIDHVIQKVYPEFFGTFEEKLVTLLDVDGKEENYIPFVFFIKNAKVGDTWKNTGNAAYSGITFNIRIQSTLRDTALTMSWDTLHITKVYKVESDIYASSANVYCGKVINYFNNGLGIIKTIADFDVMGQYSQYYRDSLIGYKIIK